MSIREVIAREVVIDSRKMGGMTLETTRMEPTDTEIVRCRDCIHFRQDNPQMHTPPKCSGVFAFVHPDPDGFCAWGRRADENRETGGR